MAPSAAVTEEERVGALAPAAWLNSAIAVAPVSTAAGIAGWAAGAGSA
jgi:hypothetical protein